MAKPALALDFSATGATIVDVMKRAPPIHKLAAQLWALTLAICLVWPAQGAEPGPAQGVGSAHAAALLAELADPDNRAWRRSERSLLEEWSKSGSAAMDLLLQRGRDALAEGQTEVALSHLTALTDHAPDFAEGWNARATAFFAAGNFGQSVADIARTLALNPDHFGALAGLGAIWSRLDEPQRALAAYRAALAIHPHKSELSEAAAALESQISGPQI